MALHRRVSLQHHALCRNPGVRMAMNNDACSTHALGWGGITPPHNGSGASFIRSMLNRLLTFRSGIAAINFR